ncbi:TonB-dependent receptor plug domain-containing protein [Vibrio sp.]|uniref:TonB-dependent receptor plug domain-containing protein n=1 Tax=Vibrio sp. TaxID=678 RepID=UPI003D0CC02B
MHYFNKSLIAVAIAFCSGPLVAQSHLDDVPSDLTVTVTDVKEDETTIKQSLNAEDISNTPTSNGNLTDYLKDNPNVRFAEGDLQGFTGGEIKPASVSINGADASQTAYMLDGININNDIDPTGALFDGSMGVNPNRSSEQAYFLDANLLSGVTVYSSDVPARLGGFTGGAVVAETRQYSGEDQVKLRYRTTQSSWASMKVDEPAKDLVNQAVPNGFNADFQPKYHKEFFSVMAEHALTDDIGMVIGFSRRDSDIEQTRMLNPQGKTDKQNHTRRSDNFLANFNWTPDVERRLEFGVRFSDYQEGKYYAENIDGNVTDSHVAYGSTIKWVQRFGVGELTATAAYDKFFDERDSSANQAQVIIDLDTEMNYELGGYGDSQIAQENTQVMLDYQFDRFTWGKASHGFSVGAAYRKTDYRFKRDQDVTQNTTMMMGDFELMNKTETTRKGRIHTAYQDYSWYMEDLIKWNSVSVRPGIRVDRDDYLGNTNLAPRFSSSWQALSNTRFNLGINRYYGRSFAAMKLAGEVLKLNDDHTRRYETITQLETPFADELSVGVVQNIGNFALSAQYVLRDNKKRIIVQQEDVAGKKVDSYSNGSHYQVDIYTLQVSNITPWVLGETHWSTTLGADWLDTDRVALNKNIDPNQLVYLDGKIMTRAQMEQAVNSSTDEWVVRLGLDMMVPKHELVWSNKVYIKAPVKGYEYVNDTPDGLEMHRSFDFGTHTQWDTRLRWQPRLGYTHRAYVQLDVLNVFDQVRQSAVKSSGSGEYGLYSPGREFWLELGYEF